MKSGLKKSLYFGLAAVSVLAAGSFATTNASAKTYAKATSNVTLKSDPATRNVASNGTNALYTKAGTLKGARVVASKSTMAALGTSKSSANYFRAYRVATTNRGSVYYKVVSFNGKYRGWIYGGKSTNVFAGGIASAKTTKDAKLPTQLTGYTLVNPKKNTLWNDPQNTQYKASKVDMSAYKSTDTFTVSGAETKTREGSLYYKVTDDQTPSITGWIYYGGVKAPNSNSVKVSYVDATTHKEVGTASVPFATADASTNLTSGTNYSAVLKGIPSGYVANNTANNSSASFESLTDAANAKNGSTVVFYVKSTNYSNNNLTQGFTIHLRDTNGNSLYSLMSSTQSAALNTDSNDPQYQVTPGTQVTSSQVEKILKAAGVDTLTQGNTTYTFDHIDSVTAGTGANVFVPVTAVYTASTH